MYTTLLFLGGKIVLKASWLLFKFGIYGILYITL